MSINTDITDINLEDLSWGTVEKPTEKEEQPNPFNAGVGEKFAFVIESSANINTNPRTEQGVITISRDLFEFYKQYFDGIK